jgi:hypothetical protein
MKLFNNDLPLPPLPPAPEPALAPDIEEDAIDTTPETRRKGRKPAPQPDERLTDFATYLRGKEHGIMTVGSYVAAVTAILRRGISPTAPESSLYALDLSPASLALYARAWRNWQRFTGQTPEIDAMAARKKMCGALCSGARGPKPSVADLKRCKWSSLASLNIDKTPHFTLGDGTTTWLWKASDERLDLLRRLMELSLGYALPDDPIERERALDNLSNLPVFA